jgi:hypothetical protein
MSDTAFADSVGNTSTLGNPRAFETILYGGLAVGVLDFTEIVLFVWLRGGRPITVFQYVASGAIGRDAYNGGWKTFLLGVMFHFVVAFGVATAFYMASRFLPILIRHAIVCGMIYGVAVYFFMNKVVIPLSAAAKLPFTWIGFLNGIIGHALLVGLPVALIARWSSAKKS